MLLISGNEALSVVPENYRYITSCLDNYYRVVMFSQNCISSDRKLKTALLEGTLTDMRLFKIIWKKFQDRFIFKKYKTVRIIGVLERGTSDTALGMLHAHLLLDIPGDFLEVSITGAMNDDLRRIWHDLHAEVGGKLSGNNRMTIVSPYDETGRNFSRYMTKPYNRGDKPARWGNSKNESYLLTANVRDLKLWSRDELPSRNRANWERTLKHYNSPSPESCEANSEAA